MSGKEGVWLVSYRNEFDGGGWALIVLDTGQIVGVDAWAGTWDGTYEYDPRTNSITMRLTVALSPEAVSTVYRAKLPNRSHRDLSTIYCAERSRARGAIRAHHSRGAVRGSLQKDQGFSAVKIPVEVSIGPMPSILLAATIGLATNTALAARSGSTVQELLLSVSQKSLQI